MLFKRFIVKINRTAYNIRHDGCPSGDITWLCRRVDLNEIFDNL